MDLLFWVILILGLCLFLFFKKCNELFTNSDSKLFKAYVINLDRKITNSNNIINYLEKRNWEYERYSAVDGTKFKNITDICKSQGYPDLTCIGNEERTGHLGTVGCYLSHINCMKIISENEYDWGLILEDDAIFTHDINIDEIFKKEPQTEFFWLSTSEFKNEIEIYDTQPGWGAQGLLIRKDTAAKLYNLLKPGSTWLKNTNNFDNKDCLLDWIIQYALVYLNIKYKHIPVVMQYPVTESNINADPDTKTPLRFVEIPYVGIDINNSTIKTSNRINENNRKITIITNPYTRVINYYNSKETDTNINEWISLGEINSLESQYDFIDNNKISHQYDHIIKSEEMTKSFPSLMKTFGIESEKPILKSARNIKLEDLTENTKNIIKSKFNKDFIAFIY